MEIHILTEFNLKMTMFGTDIGKKVILPKIWLMFGHNSVQNSPIWMNLGIFLDIPWKYTYWQSLISKWPWLVVILPKRQFCPKFGHIWNSRAQILSKIAQFEWISEFSKIYHENTHTDRVSSQNDHDWWWYCHKGNFAPNLAQNSPIWINLWIA